MKLQDAGEDGLDGGGDERTVLPLDHLTGEPGESVHRDQGGVRAPGVRLYHAVGSAQRFSVSLGPPWFRIPS